MLKDHALYLCNICYYYNILNTFIYIQEFKSLKQRKQNVCVCMCKNDDMRIFFHLSQRICFAIFCFAILVYIGHISKRSLQ